eukprot:TRINITY_DN4212_c1_g1_i1.p1 TRINITY_DN4212_c1_g1~~TRINITY_DN4212_c1_g1_i1.p1  ORF type:complete len:104 (-),score=6.59 TRINITY_DN4212_c1_g1_i1:909-1220(-)
MDTEQQIKRPVDILRKEGAKVRYYVNLSKCLLSNRRRLVHQFNSIPAQISHRTSSDVMVFKALIDNSSYVTEQVGKRLSQTERVISKLEGLEDLQIVLSSPAC